MWISSVSNIIYFKLCHFLIVQSQNLCPLPVQNEFSIYSLGFTLFHGVRQFGFGGFVDFFFMCVQSDYQSKTIYSEVKQHGPSSLMSFCFCYFC